MKGNKMKRRNPLIAIALVGSAFAVGAEGLSFGRTWSDNAREKPNIVLFISDDHGWRDSGCYGDKDARTPNIDRLASQGMRWFAE